MEERIQFLNEVSNKVVNDEKKISTRTVKEADYRKYMKKFFGIDEKTLKKVKEANNTLLNDLIKVAGDDLIENKEIEKAQVLTNMGNGRMKVSFYRDVKVRNPQTGEVMHRPKVSAQINLKSKMDKELLMKLTEQIQKG